MGRPIVREGEPTVVRIEVARGAGDVRNELAGFGVRDAGAIRSLDISAARARIEGFFGVPVAIIDPFIVEVENRVLRAAAEREARGGYVEGTNIILISDLATRPLFRPDACERTMAHELLHYQSFIGSGDRMILAGTRGQETPTWLSEGITQSFAELIHPSRDAPTYTYMHEVLAAVLLERVAGLDALKTAYRSGDFRPVQEAVDRALGEGMFAAFIGMGDGASAYAFLHAAAFGAPGRQVDEESFLSDLRVRGAMRAIGLLADPAFRRLADEAKSLRDSDEPGARERLEQVARRIMDIERLPRG